MKKTLRILTLFITLGLALNIRSFAQFNDAEKMFDSELYAQALQKYEEVISKSSGEMKYKSIYKAVACETYLRKHTEAAKRMFAAPLPKDYLWTTRFLLLRAETAKNYLRYNEYRLPKESIPGNTVFENFTADEIREKISSSYMALWPLRRQLITRPTLNESYILNVDKFDVELTPTMWDFVVSQWTDFLTNYKNPAYANEPPEPAKTFLGDKFGVAFAKSLQPKVLAGVILENSYNLGGKNRTTARELAKIERLKIPIKNYNSREDMKRDYYPKAIELLGKWSESFSSFYAKAEAKLNVADFFSRLQKPEKTVETCDEIIKFWKNSTQADKCRAIEYALKLPSFNMQINTIPPTTKYLGELDIKNIDRLYFRLYKTSVDELKSIETIGNNQNWSSLKYLSPKKFKYFLKKTPTRKWEQKISYPEKYETTSVKIENPERLEEGFYVLLASVGKNFNEGYDIMRGAILNSTNIFLIGTSGLNENYLEYLPDTKGQTKLQTGTFRLYVVNAISGQPVENAKIKAFINQNNKYYLFDYRTDGYGVAKAEVSETPSKTGNSYAEMDPLANKGKSYAVWERRQSISFDYQNPLRIYMETDRPIYRPGQKIKFKVTAIERINRHKGLYSGKQPIRVSLKDANGQNVETKTFKLNSFASASGEFTIPTDRMLGEYSLYAQLSDYAYDDNDNEYFSVEEYKRPEFEVKINDSDEILQYNKTIRIKGNVRYYSGEQVANAPLQYKVFRRPYYPFMIERSMISYGVPSVEIASGTLTSDENGEFEIPFLSAPDYKRGDKYPSVFRVEVSARDSGGRTIIQGKEFKAGKNPYVFDIIKKKGFFTADKNAELSVNLLNLNNSPVSGTARYALHLLEDFSAISTQKTPVPIRYPKNFNSDDRGELERYYENVPDGKTIKGGLVGFDGKKPYELKFPNLKQGIYRFSINIKDKDGNEQEQDIILISVNPKNKTVNLPLPAITLSEYDAYVQGETARVLLGAEKLKGVKYVETYFDDHLVSSKMSEGGISLIDLPITKDFDTALTLKWFGASDYEIRNGSVNISVSRPDKELKLSLNSPKSVKPGEKINLELSLDKKVDAEATLKIFDKSLEYYVKDKGFWIDSLYHKWFNDNPISVSLNKTNATQVSYRKFIDSYRYEEPKYPTFKLFGRFSNSYGRKTMASVSDDMDYDVGRGGGMAIAPGPSDSLEMAKTPAEQSSAQNEARKDFSETALFNPHINIVKGEANVSFTMPEQLTSWAILGYAITKDLKTGTLKTEIVTKKDMTLRLEMPRFFREGDKSQIRTIISNQTTRQIAGEVTLQITNDGNNALQDFKIIANKKPVMIKPGSFATLAWDVNVPDGIADFKVRAIVRAGNLVDGEEKEISVFPSRQRIIESDVVALDGNETKTLSLKRLASDDKTIRNEITSLRVDPQLALSILNSLPFLVQYPHECTEQLTNRFVPLSIVGVLYQNNPDLKKAVSKIPNRETITPAWDTDDSLRMTSLMETPWINNSKGKTTDLETIALLNPKNVEKKRKKALKKLRDYQLSNGAFPWFPGGREDLYMTLYVLDGFSQLARYDIDYPKDIADKAFSFVTREIENLKSKNSYSITLTLYGAYVMSSFPAQATDPKISAMIKEAVNFADKNSKYLSLKGKAYMAILYSRLGNVQKSDLYLDRITDGAMQNDVSGVYWQEEKNSWFWYGDPVEAHALVLQTLLYLRKDSKLIPGIVQWLLFNKKGNEWKSTKASASAIYSLIDFLNSRKALQNGENFDIEWNGLKESLTLGPLDWLEKPLAWETSNPSVTAQMAKATIKKEGPGFAFATLTSVYSTKSLQTKTSGKVLDISKEFFVRYKNGKTYSLRPIASGDSIKVGEEIQVKLRISTKSSFEYLYLKDPRGAGFEAERLLSKWKWDVFSRYEEPRDSLTNFFIPYLPHGEFVLTYYIRPTTPGAYRIGGATLQSMYAPEFGASSNGTIIKVIE
jgi:alpha-2-macroglobulin